ncbi:protein kinase domain-containing protein [Pyxidicoccus sp. MSG2]|uniref:serine/threonine protein kinase n=1 Tax=Pyxidicoccus sp. MSG2 TaxID=2996790 RepID=UPI003B633850
MATDQGKHFGRYELQDPIGRGGMAETWRARLMGAAGVTKSVLIKKVLPEFADDEAFISMFISEARISATLSHGNVAQVFDFGQVDGNYFLAMEFVDGQPLHHILKRAARTGLSALPIPIATLIALEMCRGLHYAHTRTDEKGQPLGIVHRDISPDNVLISYEGQVKIVDFGIAKARLQRNFNTEPGVVKGKYLFFSPEQARGKEVDARTDVWATGVVLFELLCGQRPVSGPQHTVMMRLASGDFPSPRQLRKDLPAELDEIVMRALAVDLDSRFESSHAFGDALAGFLYSFAPRFSSMNLAHLVRELFREDLARDGRELPVPPSFREELARWRSTAPTPSTAREQVQETPAPRPTPRTPVPGVPTPGEDLETVPVPVRSPSLPRGSLMAGAGLILTLAVVAVLMLDGSSAPPVGHDPSSPQPLRETNSESRSALVAPSQSEQVVATTTTSASEALEAGAGAERPSEISLRLDAQRDVILVPRSLVAFSGLKPAVIYSVSKFSDSQPPDRPSIEEPSTSNVPPLLYLLSGEQVSGDAELGRVTHTPQSFRGVSAISFFTLGFPPQHSTPEQMLQIWNSRPGSEKEFAFRPESMGVSVENAALLEGLSRAATYSLTLTPLGAGAFIYGLKRGPVRRVACVQWSPPHPARASAAGGPVAFLLVQGTEVRVRGIEALKCGFVDDDPSDNHGHMQVRAVPVVADDAPDRPLQGVQSDQLEAADRLVVLSRESLKLKSETGYREALKTATSCLTLVPDHTECLLLAGTAQARLGNIGEGARNYRRFLQVAPPNHPMAAGVRERIRRYDEARP